MINKTKSFTPKWYLRDQKGFHFFKWYAFFTGLSKGTSKPTSLIYLMVGRLRFSKFRVLESLSHPGDYIQTVPRLRSGELDWEPSLGASFCWGCDIFMRGMDESVWTVWWEKHRQSRQESEKRELTWQQREKREHLKENPPWAGPPSWKVKKVKSNAYDCPKIHFLYYHSLAGGWVNRAVREKERGWSFFLITSD